MGSATGPEAGPEPAGGRAARLWQGFRQHVLRNTLIVLAATTVVTTVVTAVTERLIAEDPPPTCPGTDCDGRSPQATGCFEDAGSHRPTEANPATLEIRHNPRCEAVWGRILTGEPGDRVTVRVAGGGTAEAQIAYETDQFTNMVAVDPARFHVEVCAVPGPASDRRATWQRYCVEATHDTDFSLR
ncbi:DUF2690 domain-containing protein [Streptomyces sp. 8K308]|uniref:DUF2690 domain-containing protein n=1 Tax=Streptomyces sp. 8K308 TaxID=2530388 RepID=UPI00105341DD|nr:DUF2690 domain-containing protein [Streptomyces sp. 8K308]TDC15480.1 DUF2690 domain-containing protein [Streptomyces sp. 8K308]